jgi:RND family efflux transporter MFP subunit
MKLFPIITWAVCACLTFNGCHNHGSDAHEHEDGHVHEEEHDHDHDHDNEAAEAGGHEHAHVDAKALGIKTVTVEPSAFIQAIKAAGRILPSQDGEHIVVAPASGTVRFAGTRLAGGSEVRRGSLLLSVSGSRIVDGNIAVRTRAAYEKALADYGRAEELNKARIMSDKEFQQAKADYMSAKASFDALGISSDDNAIEVSSPVSGFVKSIDVKEGDYVETGQQLISVGTNRRMRASFDVPSADYTQLPSVSSASFRMSFSDVRYNTAEMNGRLISYSRNTLDGAFIPVTFEFDNTSANIIPGAFIEGYLYTVAIPDVLSVPVSALIEEQGIYSVYVEEHEGAYEKREVKLGMNNGEQVQILHGLNVGEAVVTQSVYQLKLAMTATAMPSHHHH